MSKVTPELLRELENLYQACGTSRWVATLSCDDEAYVEHADAEYGVAKVSMVAESLFIAAAHNAMPALLAELARLRRVEEAARELVEGLYLYGPSHPDPHYDVQVADKDDVDKLQQALDSK